VDTILEMPEPEIKKTQKIVEDYHPKIKKTKIIEDYKP
jgi:hypothetical protein